MRETVWDRLAQVLVVYCTEVRPGDLVALEGSTLAEPLLRSLYEQVLRAGGHPHLQVTFPGLRESFFRLAKDDQLTFVSPLEEMITSRFNVRIVILSEANTRELTHVDPAKQALHQEARKNLVQTFMERHAQRDLRWVLTAFPTPAYAQDAEMSVKEFEEFLISACFLTESDPVARWRELSEQQQRYLDWLEGKHEIRIQGPDTDLILGIEGRRFINCDGKNNFPDGEFFTAPVEDSVQGHIRFSFPACYQGREVEDVRLVFQEGRVVEATASKNEEFLHQMLSIDEGAKRVGEFSFGANPHITRFTRNLLFDEKIGGTVHLALGASYPETGGRNQSALHWDMICDLRQEGQVFVDGTLFLEKGRFVVEL